MSNPWVLGISCSHNGSACLLHGDRIVAAIQDERLLRFKRQETYGRFIQHCINYCLDAGGIQPGMLNMIVWSETRGQVPNADQDIFLNDVLRAAHYRVPVLSLPHHYAHAVSAFATSGYNEAAVLVIDGSGTFFEHLPTQEQAVVMNRDTSARDWEWLSYYDASGTTLTPVFKQTGRCLHYEKGQEEFDSLGNMYGVAGAHLFGDFFDGPGKLMGLAAYGRPTIPTEELLVFEEGGIIRFKSVAFRAAAALCSWPHNLGPCADLAASVQRALEYAVERIVERVRSVSRSANLCYAGGVALNSIANERIVRGGGFEQVFIMPAAEDSGVAVGAAYHGLWQLTGRNTCRRMNHDAMGRTYSARDVDCAMTAVPAIHAAKSMTIAKDLAMLLCTGKIVGWFVGRSELGPRSLGQRSILCDPRPQDIKQKLNDSVKRREGFRPFAPAILREHAQEWFDVPANLIDSPFMLRVWTFRPDKAHLVPAVAHIDNTARVQTLTPYATPLLYEVVKLFFQHTGIPMVLNTSLNVAGEPIVETPEDALWCMLSTGLDCCAFEDRIVYKRTDTTLLDLSPQLSATAIFTEAPIVGGRIVSQGTEKPGDLPWLKPVHPEHLRQLNAKRLDLHAVTTPLSYGYTRVRWGESAVILKDEYLKLLTLINGRRDGHALLQMGPAWTKEWLIGALAALYRSSLIRFKV